MQQAVNDLLILVLIRAITYIL